MARTHELELTEVHVTFSSEGTFRIEVMNDPGWLLMRVEPFSGLGLSGRLDPPARDRRLAEMEPTFADWVHLYFDGERAATSASYLPPAEDGPTAPDGTALGVMRLDGRVPSGAEAFSFAYGLIMDPYPLLIRDGSDEVITYWNVGEYETEPMLLGELTPPTRWQVVGTYLQLGFTHIVPKGIDHILFVIGIFLLGTRLTPMLAQVTTFTVAHTMTLGLTMFGVLSLPSRVVEPLIALSIAYVAIENIVTSELKPWRLALVFGVRAPARDGVRRGARRAGAPPRRVRRGVDELQPRGRGRAAGGDRGALRGPGLGPPCPLVPPRRGGPAVAGHRDRRRVLDRHPGPGRPLRHARRRGPKSCPSPSRPYESTRSTCARRVVGLPAGRSGAPVGLTLAPRVDIVGQVRRNAPPGGQVRVKTTGCPPCSRQRHAGVPRGTE